MSGGGNTQVQKSEPSDFIRPYLTPGLDEARTFFGEGPSRHYSETEDGSFRSAIAGFTPQTNAALGALFSRGMGGAGQRASTQNALDTFTGGGMYDSVGVDRLRNLGMTNNGGPAAQNISPMAQSNDYRRNPAYGTVAGVTAGGGMHHAQNLYDRTRDIIQNGAVDPMMGRMEGLLSGGGMNLSRNLHGRIGDLTTNGGNVAGYSQGAVGDITAAGAGSNSQIRGDINDLITGEAQARNPGLTNLGLTGSGAFLGGNPWLDDTFGRAATKMTDAYQRATAPGIDSAFAGRGRYGSGLHANAQGAAASELGDALSGLATNVYGGAYDAERNRMEAANANLSGQYLAGQGLRASTAGQSAAQASDDARLRLAATGQISGDMAGDLARRMAAAKDMTGAEQQDWSNLMGGMDRLSQMHDAATSRRMQASQNMMGAEQADFQNLLAGTDRMSGMYDAGAQRQLAANQLLNATFQSGADRQIDALRNSADVYAANRGQQLQSLGLVPQYQAMDYTDLGQALGAGQMRDALAQRQLDERVAAFDFGQNAPWANLQRYLALVNGGSPYMTTSTTGGGDGTNAFMSALGSLGRAALLGK